MVIDWCERQLYEDGGTGGWYRGMSTFVFDSDGNDKEYDGVFDLVSLQAALERPWFHKVRTTIVPGYCWSVSWARNGCK